MKKPLRIDLDGALGWWLYIRIRHPIGIHYRIRYRIRHPIGIHYLINNHIYNLP